MNPSASRLTGLAILLVLQLGLALGLGLTQGHSGAFQSDTPLLAFNSAEVDQLLISDGDGKQVELRKQGDHWVLPKAENFPVSHDRVINLLGKLAALKTPWPVATTASAAARFKVADDQFNRRVTLRAGDRVLAQLYFGTSPGYRKVNARVDGQDKIYSVNFGVFEVPAKTSAWEDKTLLSLNSADIEQLALPEVTLVRKDDKFEVDPLNDGEQTAASETQTLVQRVAALTYTASAGKTAPAKADKEKPVFEFSVKLKSGETRQYRFLPTDKADAYLLNVSTQPWWFRVSRYTLDNLKGETRGKLVKQQTEGTKQDSQQAG